MQGPATGAARLYSGRRGASVQRSGTGAARRVASVQRPATAVRRSHSTCLVYSNTLTFHIASCRAPMRRQVDFLTLMDMSNHSNSFHTQTVAAEVRILRGPAVKCRLHSVIY